MTPPTPPGARPSVTAGIGTTRGVPARTSRPVAPPAVDVVVEAGDWASPAKLRRLATRALAAAVARARPRLAAASEVTLLFSDDARVRTLNRRYRRKDRATNVLSFPAAPVAAGALGPLLGDVVLAAETLSREAADEGLAFDDHLTHLIVHGFLHLIGYDHEEDGEADVMEGLETAILGDLGIADPYRPR
jgi:probable rRNA maturation factor